MKYIKKAVIPIAGFGTRFLPITKAVPKALLPIVDTPAIHYLVEEALQLPVEEIIFVISENQESIKHYFSTSKKLEQKLFDKGMHDLLESVRNISRRCKFHYTYQDKQLGDGHAILCVKDYIKNEPFLVLFGDDIVDPPIAKHMYEVFKKKQSSILAIQEIPKKNVTQYGIIKPKTIENEIYEIEELVEKPEADEAPSNLGIVGKYICTPDILEILEQKPTSKDNEIRLIDAFKEQIKTKPIYGYKFNGIRYDIGNKWGYLRINIDFALKRPDLKDNLMNFLSSKK